MEWKAPSTAHRYVEGSIHHLTSVPSTVRPIQAAVEGLACSQLYRQPCRGPFLPSRPPSLPPGLQAMERYGCDKPDMRYGLELRTVTPIVRDSTFRLFTDAIASGGAVKAIAVSDGSKLKNSALKAKGEVYDAAVSAGASGLEYARVAAAADGASARSPVARRALDSWRARGGPRGGAGRAAADCWTLALVTVDRYSRTLAILTVGRWPC